MLKIQQRIVIPMQARVKKGIRKRYERARRVLNDVTFEGIALRSTPSEDAGKKVGVDRQKNAPGCWFAGADDSRQLATTGLLGAESQDFVRTAGRLGVD
jgi:cyanophycinase-like exopeptidase